MRLTEQDRAEIWAVLEEALGPIDAVEYSLAPGPVQGPPRLSVVVFQRRGTVYESRPMFLGTVRGGLLFLEGA
jgi:hypothetical protein